MSDKDWDEATEALLAYEKSLIEEFNKTLKIVSLKVSKDYFEGIESYVQYCWDDGGVFGFEIVNSDIKNLTIDNEFNSIKISVNQTCNGGYTGDSYEGYILIHLVDNEYLKFNYTM